MVHPSDLAPGDPMGGLMMPTSSFKLRFDERGELIEPTDGDYGRVGNPTYNILERQMNLAHGAQHSVVFGSGIAALTAVVQSLKQGDVVVAEQNTYGCTMRMLEKVFAKFGLQVHYLDFSDPSSLARLCSLRPTIVMIESPTNPLLKVLDIEQISQAAKAVGAPLVVDNSFASCFVQQPLRLGATVVVESLTKYVNGHSTAMIGSASTNDPEWAEKLLFARKAVGLQPGVLEAFMTAEFLQDIELRMQRHSDNALAVAEFLESLSQGQDALVKSVRYPLLPSHPQYELAKKQMRLGSGIVTADFSFDVPTTIRFIQALDPFFTLAHSIGSTKSQVSIPAAMSHASVAREKRLAAGIQDGTVRFSLGIENKADLIDALKRALKHVCH
jgi:cystathionine gamma-synthase